MKVCNPIRPRTVAPLMQGFFMAFQELGLFGDPVELSVRGVGRPWHIPTDEKRSLINDLRAEGRTQEAIARTLNISPPTLRRHYFFELRSAVPTLKKGEYCGS